MWPNSYQARGIYAFSVTAVFSIFPYTTAKAQVTKDPSRNISVQQGIEIRELRQRIKILEDKLLEQSAPAKSATAASQVIPQTPSPLPAVPSEQPPSRKADRAGSSESGMQVDEVAAQRALERTLTQTGALLLPRGVIELTPSASYSLDERDISRLAVVSTPDGTQSLAPVIYRNRRTTTFAGLALRAGLPLATQFEASLGGNRVSLLEKNDFGASQRDNVSGRGDISVAIAKTLAKEKGWRPDMVGRITYNFGSTPRQAGLAQLPGTFRQVQGEFMMLKRQDPIAFTFGANLVRSFEKNGFRPGDSALFSLGAALAASPQTSLQVAYFQVKNNEARQDGVKIAGSDQMYGILTFGASSVVSARTTVIAQIGVGLGRDAPKFTASLSMPIIFF